MVPIERGIRGVIRCVTSISTRQTVHLPHVGSLRWIRADVLGCSLSGTAIDEGWESGRHTLFDALYTQTSGNYPSLRPVVLGARRDETSPSRMCRQLERVIGFLPPAAMSDNWPGCIAVSSGGGDAHGDQTAFDGDSCIRNCDARAKLDF